MFSLRVSIIIMLLVVLFSTAAITSFSTNSATTPGRELQWVIDENIGCLNSSFCARSGGMSSLEITANAFSDHTAFDIVMLTSFSKSGAVVSRSIERDSSIWTVQNAPNSPFGPAGIFFLASGTNRTTLFANGHRSDTIRQINNFDTGIPAQQGSYGCVMLIGVTCPNGVSAHLSITNVPSPTTRTIDSVALQPADVTSDSGVGIISWVVSAQLGCFNPQFCKPTSSSTALRSEAGTWTLFSGHIAFGVIIGTQFNSAGLVTERYMEHVTATNWKIGPSSDKVNDFWIVSGVAETTVYQGGHQTTTISQLSDVDTGAPAQQATFTCAQIMGSSCPGDVTAFESVTQVG
jgi:hypothetical protein